MKPNRLSEPTFRNARRSKSLYMVASMIEDERLRIENGPQHVLKSLAAGVGASTPALDSSDDLRRFAVGRRMHQRRHEEAPRDFLVGQRLVRKPSVERAILAGDLVLDGLPADQVHRLCHIGRIIALANHFTRFQPAESLKKISRRALRDGHGA